MSEVSLDNLSEAIDARCTMAARNVVELGPRALRAKIDIVPAFHLSATGSWLVRTPSGAGKYRRATDGC